MNKYYTTITELPVYNWWQYHDTGEYKYILINPKDAPDENGKEAAAQLQDDFVQHFGINDKYKVYMRLMCDIELGRIKQALTGDRSNELLIKAKELKLKTIFPDHGKSNNFSFVVAVEKFLGRKIDIRKESTFDFYNYLNELVKWQKAKK